MECEYAMLMKYRVLCGTNAHKFREYERRAQGFPKCGTLRLAHLDNYIKVLAAIAYRLCYAKFKYFFCR